MALTKVSYGVISADASSIDLNIDANTLYIDSSENRVGIGTTSPSYGLEIEGTTDFGNTTTYNNAAAGLISWNAGTKFKIRGASNHALSLGAGGTEDYLYILTDGKVGIGTTAPASTLDVVGDMRLRTSSGYYLYNTSNVFRAAFHDNGSITRIFADGDGSNSIMCFNNSKVGIGTDSPLDLLHLNSSSGDVRMLLNAPTDSDAEIKFSENGTVKYTIGHDAASDNFVIGTTNVDTEQRLVIDSAGSVGIGTQDPQYKLDVSGTSDITMRIHRPSSGLASTDTCGIGFSQRGDSNVSTSDTRAGIFSSYNGDLFLAVEAGGNLNSNPMDHSALFIEGANGRVGIGTTSPSESLEVNLGDIKVQGGANATTRGLIIAHTGQTGNLTMLRQDASGSRAILETTERNLRISAGSGGGTGTAETLDFFVNGAERMMIDTSGNVGIGNSSPSKRLQIKDTTQTNQSIQFGPHGAAYGEINYNSTGTEHLYIDCHGTTSGYGNIVFRTGPDPAERMRIDSSGNVGIGTTSPSRKLEVAGVIQSNGTIAGGGGMLFMKATDASSADDNPYGRIRSFNSAGTVVAEIKAASEGTGNNKAHWEFFTYDGSSSTNKMRIRDNGTVQVFGALSKGSGSFEIPHPLESKKDTHLLRHSFIEGPQCDNIYRGTIELLNGTATVDLDEKFTMTNGTFVALNRNVQVFTTNESDWDNVKGSVVGNTLTITCQNSSSNATVSWLVVGERQDDNIKSSTITNNDGKLILEPEVYEGGT